MSLLSFLPVLIILSGTFLLIKLRFFFLIRPIRTLKFAFSGKNKKKSILSLILALAGTLGVGNISGVAIGIAVGGAGSVFWLIISALFSSAIKYSEVYLSYRSGGRGMIDVIKGSFKHAGAVLSFIYAMFAVILSVSMGSAFQARAISEAADNSGEVNILLLAALLSVFVVFVCILGKDRIKGAVAVTIPVATIIYTGMCLFVVFANLQKLPETVLTIFHSAFSTKSAAGGILGFITASGMKEGFARGLLSNEAGAGTSSFSHTSHVGSSKNVFSDYKSSEAKSTDYIKDRTISHLSDEDCKRAGIFGILEVVFDTLLLCPLTAFAIFLGYDGENFSGSLGELSEIFEDCMGKASSALLLYSIIFFAVSTTLCWYYYGRVSLDYISGGKGVVLYSAVFFIAFFVAVTVEIPHVLFITDTALFILSVISLSALIKNRALLHHEDTPG